MNGPVAGRHRERNGRGVVEEALAVVEAAGGDAWCGWGRRKQRLIGVRAASVLAIHDGAKSRRPMGATTAFDDWVTTKRWIETLPIAVKHVYRYCSSTTPSPSWLKSNVIAPPPFAFTPSL